MSSAFKTDVTSFFNRTIQKAEEAFNNSTEKTPIDETVAKLTTDCQTRQKWANALIGFVENVVEPNPANRMEDMVLQSVDKKKTRPNEHSKLGESFSAIGEQIGAGSAHGGMLTKAGQCESTMANSTLDLKHAIETNYIKWLRDYIQSSCKPALAEREKLDNLRLDLDRAKNQLKRAANDASKKQKFEQQVTEAKTLFDRQLEITKQQLEQCVSEFDKHRDALRQLIIAQRDYHSSCLKALESALN